MGSPYVDEVAKLRRDAARALQDPSEESIPVGIQRSDAIFDFSSDEIHQMDRERERVAQTLTEILPR